MGWLAKALSDRAWGFLLWLMRRPTSKAFRRWLLARFPPSVRTRLAASWTRQDQLARRIGRRLLFWSFYILIWSVTLTAVYRGALWLIENDLLPLPKRS